ncbi:MAG TPA: Fe-S oxidoreductase [Clostridiales bacterium]|nr:Fe-S oxidoreductase [Clostridiales bacterium]
MRLPLLSDGRMIDEGAAQAMVDRAIEGGVNYFDTAYAYHHKESEPFLGRALKKHNREKVFIATKMPPWFVNSAADVHRIFDEQLAKLQTDYFDYYLVHSYDAENAQKGEKIGIYDILKKKQREGKIRHLGFSTHDSLEGLSEVARMREWDFAQIQLNYMDWTLLHSKEQYEILRGLSIPIIVMEPVRGGTLATLNDAALTVLLELGEGASPASFALRYAASLPGVFTVLSGMSDMRQLEDNIKTMSAFSPITEREKDVLYKTAEAYMASGAIPCTGCGYCMDCPSGVDIPRVISLYNEYCKNGNKMAFGANYISIGEDSLAHKCTACGQCEGLCPQGIPISEHMAKIAAFAKEQGYVYD